MLGGEWLESSAEEKDLSLMKDEIDERFNTSRQHAFCNLADVARVLAGEDWGKEVIEHLSFLHVPHDQVSNFLLSD